MERSAFIWALLFCIVFVNGAMAAPGAGHAQHHADHQAGTHSTGICAWLCAAGQDIESTSMSLESAFQLVEQTVVVPSNPLRITISFHSSFRGPPQDFLA